MFVCADNEMFYSLITELPYCGLFCLSCFSMIKQRQPASSKNGSVVITVDRNQIEKNLRGNDTSSWTKLVMDMYPPGSSPR